MTNTEVIEKINEILIDEFEVDAIKIVPDAALMETLELDSLDLVDIVVLVDRYFGVSITAQDFKTIITIQDFYDFVIKKIGEKQEKSLEWAV